MTIEEIKTKIENIHNEMIRTVLSKDFDTAMPNSMAAKKLTKLALEYRELIKLKDESTSEDSN